MGTLRIDQTKQRYPKTVEGIRRKVFNMHLKELYNFIGSFENEKRFFPFMFLQRMPRDFPSFFQSTCSRVIVQRTLYLAPHSIIESRFFGMKYVGKYKYVFCSTQTINSEKVRMLFNIASRGGND